MAELGQEAFLLMASELGFVDIEREAELADIEAVNRVVTGGKRGIVPSFGAMSAELDVFNRFDLSMHFMFNETLVIHALVLIIFLLVLFFIYFGLFRDFRLFKDLLICYLDTLSCEPFVKPSVLVFVMNVIVIGVLCLLLLRIVI